MKLFINPSKPVGQVHSGGPVPPGGLPEGGHRDAHAGLAPWLDPRQSLPPDPGGQRYRQALDVLARRPGDPIALSVSLPFCAVHCLSCDRDIQAAPPEAVLDDYVATLVQEIHALADRLGGPREVLQLQLGGGSTNVLGESHLAQLVHALRQRWTLPSDAELSAECDPRRTGWSQLRLLRGLGFRQLSFGTLDLDPSVQRACGRLQSAALIDDVCAIARSCGIDCITLDMTLGLPMQTEARWRNTLKTLVAIAPDRVTLGRYRHRPHQVRGHCAIDADALPDDAQCRRLSAMSAEVLCGVGYRWIGADHFVLDADPLAIAQDENRLRRNLIGYTATPPMPVLGLGAGAIGEIDGAMYGNERSLPAWREAVRTHGLPGGHAQATDVRQTRWHAAIQHLLCRLELPSALLEGGLEDLYRQLADQAADGLVQVLDDRIVVTEAGRHDLMGLCAGLHTRWAAGARPTA